MGFLFHLAFTISYFKLLFYLGTLASLCPLHYGHLHDQLKFMMCKFMAVNLSSALNTVWKSYFSSQPSFSFFMATFQTFAIFVSFPIHLLFLALSLDNFSFYFTAKIKAMDWTLLQLWGGCIAQQLIALALDLNLEFIKVYSMVSIFSSLTSCVRIRANYFCVSQFSHLKMETTGLLRIKWVTTSNMLKTIPGT